MHIEENIRKLKHKQHDCLYRRKPTFQSTIGEQLSSTTYLLIKGVKRHRLITGKKNSKSLI